MTRLLFEDSALPADDSESMRLLREETLMTSRAAREHMTLDQLKEGWEQSKALLNYWEKKIEKADPLGWATWKSNRVKPRCYRPELRRGGRKRK